MDIYAGSARGDRMSLRVGGGDYIMRRTQLYNYHQIQVLFDASNFLDQANAAPAKRNDILAGTEFLSVFINGAMAPTPRRRGFRRGNGSNSNGNGDSGSNALQDNVAEESRVNEASIYRISRTPSSLTTMRPGHRQIGMQLYPISHKSMEHRPNFTPAFPEESENTDQAIGVRLKPPMSTPSSSLSLSSSSASHINREILIRNNGSKNLMTHKGINRKVIGVSVTSTVEATPYRVRVEHYDNDKRNMMTRPPVETSTSTVTTKPLSTIASTTSKTVVVTTRAPIQTSTTLPARLVTEELSNIVSESNRSEFSVDEGSPRTSWRARSSVTPGTIIKQSTPFMSSSSSTSSSSSVTEAKIEHRDSMVMGTSSEPVEQSYELPEENSESPESHEEPREVYDNIPQGRKVGRHYDTSLFNQPPKVYPQPSKIYGKPSRVYGEPAKVYSEPAKIYSEPSKIYSEPSKIYGEPARIYGEPEKIYGEPSKIYSEPARIYSEPAKVYSEPAKVYGEPSKIYGSNGQPVNHEVDEQNYEVDEAVSVGSNGNVHGPQIITEAPNASTVDDGHKVGYVVEGRNYRKYRVEERTPDGFIVGEYGVVSHDDGSLRGVRYTADGTINPRLIYDALMKFLAL
ncbi:hypothetical protein PV326_003714 [Microctonus aethiopoides]|nr:hypothetical protein PV326_003714 [Microctonus aethiopoides]